jgi:hypothetical protein
MFRRSLATLSVTAVAVAMAGSAPVPAVGPRSPRPRRRRRHRLRYGSVVGGAFLNGSLSSLSTLPAQMLLASNKAQVFIDNHDTERNGTTKLNYKSGARHYLAEGFMLAYPFGTPSVMSGFNFSSSDQGPPTTSKAPRPTPTAPAAGPASTVIAGSRTWSDCAIRPAARPLGADKSLAPYTGARNS